MTCRVCSHLKDRTDQEWDRCDKEYNASGIAFTEKGKGETAKETPNFKTACDDALSSGIEVETVLD